jgi:hypothetical protein
VMQGKGEAVEKVVESVRKGPRSARVEGVEVREEKIGEEFADFKVVEGVTEHRTSNTEPRTSKANAQRPTFNFQRGRNDGGGGVVALKLGL